VDDGARHFSDVGGCEWMMERDTLVTWVGVSGWWSETL